MGQYREMITVFFIGLAYACHLKPSGSRSGISQGSPHVPERGFRQKGHCHHRRCDWIVDALASRSRDKIRWRQSVVWRVRCLGSTGHELGASACRLLSARVRPAAMIGSARVRNRQTAL